MQLDPIAILRDPKPCPVMLAREDSAAPEMVNQRSRVSPRDVNALMSAGEVFPNNGDTVRGVLTGEAEQLWHSVGSDVFQPDQADACNRVAVLELGPKR